jgi:Phasin protein
MIMQNDYIESLTKLSQTLLKPITELTELNVTTLNKLAKSDALEEITKAKKPEEFVAAQLKLYNAASLEAIKHTQEACGILLTAATQTGKVIEDILRKTTAKTTDYAQAGINKVKEKNQG